MDNTKKFDNKADVYLKGRPSYPDELTDFLKEKFGLNKNSAVADVGSGTGIFTEKLAKICGKVYAVEPNEDMRRTAETRFKIFTNVVSVDGCAENTALDGCSVDFVTAAQAFHWFDVNSFGRECRRILKRGGKTFLVWNRRDMSAKVNLRLYDVCKKYCRNFTGFSGGENNTDDKIRTFYGGGYIEKEFVNPVYYPREKFVSRCLSSSYSLSESDAAYADYLRALNEIFDEFATGELLCVPNSAVLYFSRKDFSDFR